MEDRLEGRSKNEQIIQEEMMKGFWIKLIVVMVMGAIFGIIQLFRERDAKEISREEYDRICGKRKNDCEDDDMDEMRK